MFSAYNWCAFPEDDPKRDETYWSCNILIVKLYLHFVGCAYIIINQNTNMNNIIKTENINFFSTGHFLSLIKIKCR